MTYDQAKRINRAAWDLSQLCRDAHADYALTELTKLAARLSDAAVDAMPAQQEAAA